MESKAVPPRYPRELAFWGIFSLVLGLLEITASIWANGLYSESKIEGGIPGFILSVFVWPMILLMQFVLISSVYHRLKQIRPMPVGELLREYPLAFSLAGFLSTVVSELLLLPILLNCC